jgi:hypothetical protein
MATKPKPTSKPQKPALPVALARRAEALSAAKQARLREEATGLLALVQRRKRQIAEAFYDLGVALGRLKQKEMLLVLGCKSFDQLCTTKLDLSTTLANRLVDVASAMTRDEAIGMGQAKAMAFVDLAAATPEDDTPGGLARARKPLALPGGKTLDLRTASGRAIERGAKAIRDARAAGKPRRGRGRTTTADERATAAALEAALHSAGVPGARVTAVATKPTVSSDLRVEHLPIDKLDAVAAAFAKHRRRR